MSRSTLGCVLAAGLLAAVAVVEQRVGLALALVLLLVLAAAVRSTSSPSPGFTLLGVGLAVQPALRDAGWVVAVAVAGGLTAAAAVALRPSEWAGLRAVGLAPWHWLRGTVLVGRAVRALLPESPTSHLGPLVRGVALALLLVVSFGALLTAADSAFAELLDDVLAVEVRSDVLVARVLTGLAVVGTAGALVHAAARPRVHGPAPARRAPGTIELRIAIGALTLLFGAFVAVQLRVLFGGADYVQETTGLGYGEYARQGFVQLLLTAALTLGVIAVAARRRDRLVRVLLGVVCGLVLVMLVSAHHRLDLVEGAYGFSRVRFGGHAIVFWLAGVFGLVLAAGAHVHVRRLAPRAALGLTLGGVLAFSLSNPDGRIAGRAADRALAGGEVDVSYLTTLSADALPAARRLPPAQRAPVVRALERDLERADGVAGWNVSRSRAR